MTLDQLIKKLTALNRKHGNAVVVVDASLLALEVVEEETEVRGSTVREESLREQDIRWLREQVEEARTPAAGCQTFKINRSYAARLLAIIDEK